MDIADRYGIESPTPVDYINRLSDDLGLEESQRERALYVTGQEPGRYGAASANIAAAAISHYTDFTDAPGNRKKDVAEYADVTRVSVGRASRRIAEANPGIAAELLVDAMEETGALEEDPSEWPDESGSINRWKIYFNRLPGLPSMSVYEDVFGSFEEALEAAGLSEFDFMEADAVKDSVPVEENIYRISEELGLDYAGIKDAVEIVEEARDILPKGELTGTSRQIAADAVNTVADRRYDRESIAEKADIGVDELGKNDWMLPPLYRKRSE